MRSNKARAVICLVVCGLGLILLMAGKVRSERLPIKTYTTADGLGHNEVNRAVRDSRGFLWFCTYEGLSRFDGYSFTNYGIEQGLPSGFINHLLETREGQYWVATAAGLCRFNPLGKPQASINNASERNAPDQMFTVYFPGEDARSKHVISLLEDRAGRIWCGTRNGLYLLEAANDEVKFTQIDLRIPDRFEDRYIESLMEDRLGALWVGSRNGLYRRWPDGRVEAYTTRNGLPSNWITRLLLEDREGRIWVSTASGGVCRLAPDPTPGRNVVARTYTDKDGLLSYWTSHLFQATDGSLWAGTGAGLVRFIPTADGRDFRFRVYGQAQGLSFPVGSLAEDRNGNLWLATFQGGVAKMARNGFTAFDKEDGLFWNTSILETRAGDVLVLGSPETPIDFFINKFDGEKFIPVRPKFSEYVKKAGYGWGWNQTVLEDHTGEWWIATFAGLCRFPRVSRPEQLAHTPPKAVYTTRDGLATELILRLYEDSRGDIWIGTVGHGVRPNGLSRWERSTGIFHHYTEKDGLPRFDIFYVSSLVEDLAGALWIGFSGDGGLARYRDGRFTIFKANDGVPAGQIYNMLIDSAGRLWAANARGGLIRTDDPSAERPRFITYTTADGLSSNEIKGVSEDRWG
ncbi:MAG TPA: two-component regulator propeller domain-containing protein, partial [Blastocatellia bacterium]|nr:two-component regulator propeller domain-containing protein [Blastocatellia bacterium]